MLDLGPNCTVAEIEQAFSDKCAVLQAKMAMGNPRDVRLRAQGELARLPVARDLLIKIVNSQGAGTARPIASTGPTAGQWISMMVSNFQFTDEVAAAMSWAIAALMMIFIVVAFYRMAWSGPAAEFRVYSVPWCYVGVDGKSVGVSGQAVPFEAPSGLRRLTFERDGKRLIKRVRLKHDRLTIIKVRFEKEQINVEQKHRI